MKTLIALPLQFPVYCIVVNGLAALTGISVWWCIPICVVVMLSYDIGEMIRRDGL
jgi:hypothetical protein